jgi:hypothetical protein
MGFFTKGDANTVTQYPEYLVEGTQGHIQAITLNLGYLIFLDPKPFTELGLGEALGLAVFPYFGTNKLALEGNLLVFHWF